ncbi:hypothetical protein [Sphingomonas sp. SRS2]|uniref:hypothetical protein n=1 Tax=Sphingomonas sp. SRS2 TaxID=133190 RepID=UPI0006183F2B|nr:hypothetical protein [Sphingomonas sp. SRS2]KKC25972.1 hypothetical protein WP12_11610 [Sphingomonas sp. SRS2]
MDSEVFRPMFYGLVMWASAFYAFRRGGWEERLVAISMILGSYMSALVPTTRASFEHVEASIAVVDLCLFVSLQLIALRSKKFWPLWIASIQGVSVLGHLAPLIPNMQPAAAYNAVALWSYPSWVILALAVRSHYQKMPLKHVRRH